MLLLRHKAAGLGGRGDTASISQSLLSLGMSYESWVATSNVQILFVTAGSTPEVLLNNKSFTNTYQVVSSFLYTGFWEKRTAFPKSRLLSLHCEDNSHIITTFIAFYQCIFSGFSLLTHCCLEIHMSGEYF